MLRGLHFQTGENAQSKLVRVIQGEVLDVAVDLRKGSNTYGHHVEVILNSAFVVLSETAEFLYKCDNYYNPTSEGGIHPIENQLGINWIISELDMVISQKDTVLPSTYVNII